MRKSVSARTEILVKLIATHIQLYLVLLLDINV